MAHKILFGHLYLSPSSSADPRAFIASALYPVISPYRCRTFLNMKLTLPILGFLALAVAVSADLAALNKLIWQSKIQQRKTLARRQEGCTRQNVAVRKEWCDSHVLRTMFSPANYHRGNLSKHQRLAYIDAVLCLQSKPSISPPGLVPGARSRFDDFQAIHINQTYSIHFTVGASDGQLWS